MVVPLAVHNLPSDGIFQRPLVSELLRVQRLTALFSIDISAEELPRALLIDGLKG